MDIDLPGIDGYEATRRVREHPALRSVPVVAVTAYALSGDHAKAFAAGCNVYVPTPFSPRRCSTRCATWCDGEAALVDHWSPSPLAA